jgi:hypothetical protein
MNKNIKFELRNMKGEVICRDLLGTSHKAAFVFEANAAVAAARFGGKAVQSCPHWALCQSPDGDFQLVW